jgi:hypothetical protein
MLRAINITNATMISAIARPINEAFQTWP